MEKNPQFRPDDPAVHDSPNERPVDEHDRRRPVDFRPHFVIPYWTDSTAPPIPGHPVDDGDVRPIPNSVPSYLCPAIRTSPYAPGNYLTVEVDVRNFGDGNSPSLARVTVWWTNPTTGFVVEPANLIGFATFPVDPRGRQATSPPMTRMIPASAPPHVCLVARVSHPLDVAGTLPNPGGVRHWAQRNLWVAVAKAKMPILVPFIAGNPFADVAEFTLSAGIVPRDHHPELANVMRAAPIDIDARLTFGEDADRLTRSATRDLAGRKHGQPHVVQLRGGERRLVHLLIEPGTAPLDGQVAGLQIVQHHDRQLIGSLGIAIQGR